MPIKYKHVFPVANTNDVCLAQTTAGAGNLSLNGKLSQTNNTVPFIQYGYSRSISLTSTVDLSGVNFTITGSQNNAATTETIAGPNNNTVYGTGIYDNISSISVDAAVGTAVQVGTGYLGFFPLIGINLYSTVINYSLSTAKITAASIHTTIYNTLDDIYNNGVTFTTNIANNENLFSIKASAADAQFILPVANVIPCRYILIYINGVVGEIANSIQMNFIQV